MSRTSSAITSTSCGGAGENRASPSPLHRSSASFPRTRSPRTRSYSSDERMTSPVSTAHSNDVMDKLHTLPQADHSHNHGLPLNSNNTQPKPFHFSRPPRRTVRTAPVLSMERRMTDWARPLRTADDLDSGRPHRSDTPPTPARSSFDPEQRVNALHRRRFESVGRTVSVDTSRAKSNQPCVSMCCDMIGWKEYPEGRPDNKLCHIYWHNIVYNDMRSTLKAGSKVNKFPGLNELARKISLTRTLGLMQRLFPEDFMFYPKSWVIPDQLDRFYQDFYLMSGQSDDAPDTRRSQTSDDDDGDTADRPNWYIVKPDDGAQGDGIYLISNPNQLKDTKQKQVIQDYVAYPFLLKDKLKFDLRVYAVIRSLNPLTVYVSREGMARFCTQEYNEPSEANQHHAFMHLTNYSLNKTSADYVHTNSLHEEGNKRLLTTVFHQMEARGVNTTKIWHKIKLLIVKTTLALVPELMLRYEHTFNGTVGPTCFQIIGFDILLTDDLQPMLLEINACPSLSLGHELSKSKDPDFEDLENEEPPVQVNSVVDEAIKVPLVRDTLLLVMDELELRNRASSAVERSASFGAANPLNLEESFNGLPQSCLTEIFPGKYQQMCGHLLVLDKAAYLFMQFVNLKKTINITMNGCRMFARKCRLLSSTQSSELDTMYCDVLRAQNKREMKNAGIPFNGFVEILLMLSRRHFSRNGHYSLLDSFDALIEHCVSKLRHHGVRSARLRHKAITVDPQSSNSRQSSASSKRGSDLHEIYMLPQRVPQDIWRQSAGQTRKRPVIHANNTAHAQPPNSRFTLPKIRL